jgi:hypothetical protein
MPDRHRYFVGRHRALPHLFAANGINVGISASGLVRDRGVHWNAREDYLGSLRSALRVARAMKSPTRS